MLLAVSKQGFELEKTTPNVTFSDTRIIIGELERLNSSISVFLSKVMTDNESSLVVLSCLDDLQRQIKESFRILNAQLNHEDAENEMNGIGVLDEQSELTRRKLLGKSFAVQKLVSRLFEQLQFLENTVKKQQIRHSLPYANQARFKRIVMKDSSRCILESLAKGYNRTKLLDKNVSQLMTELESKNQADSKGNAGIPPKGKRGHRNRLCIAPLPFASPISHSKGKRSFPENNLSLLKAMQTVKKSHGQPVKHFPRREIQFLPPCDTSSTKASWKKGHSSKLMSSLSTLGATSNTALVLSSPQLSKKKDLFASSHIDKRSDWDGSSAESNELSSLSIPTSLKKIDVKKAEKEALVAFGVTPEKMSKVFETKLRADAVKLSTDKLRPSQKAIARDTKEMSSVSVDTFPPTSSKTIAFSSKIPSAPASSVLQSAVSSKVKDPKIAPKDLNGAYPPVSSKAPTPFGSSSTEKEAILDSKSKAQKIDGAKLSSGGSVFESVGLSVPSKESTNFEAKKKESPSLPFGSNAAPAFAPSTSKSMSNTFQSSEIQPNYEHLLTVFYQNNNPSKLSEVKSNLQKYAGKEKEMFSKLSQKYGVPNPLDQGTGTLKASTAQPNYEDLLIAFYQKHNPSKLSEVKSNLQKYAGKEKDMFLKLSQKYGVPNPLITADTGSAPFGQSHPPSAFGGSTVTQAASPFGQPNSTVPFGNSSLPGMTASPFASSKSQQATPFGSSSVASTSTSFETTSGFGSSAPPFGASSNSTSDAPFAQNQGAQQSSFGTKITPSTTPFGQNLSPVPFGSTTSSGSTFGGKSARDILTSFYQQHNPSKVDEIDKLLQKYVGNEEQLFRNLAKKYNMDPSMFGVSSNASTPSFGSPSTFGQSSAPATSSGFGSSPFGQSSALGSSSGFGNSAPSFGQTSGFGGVPSGQGGGFASFSQSAQGSGFGALAGSTPSFGSPTGGFGATSNPFGSARR